MNGHSWRVFVSAAALTVSLAAPSIAADGYFLIGYGPRQKALGGAGVADSRDAMSLSVNPAGLVDLERQMQLGVTALLPERGYSTDGLPRVIAPGDVRSGRPIFPVPHDAYAAPIDADSAWGTASYANGGINTSFDFGHYHPPLGGPFGGGYAGVDLEQAFTSVGYAQKFGSLSIGAAPTIAVQTINLQGLKAFSPYSSDMYRLSDNGYDWSVGGGVRFGAQWRVTDQFRIGVAASTPMFMTRFAKYAGLFADGGRFDIPASIIAGVAYDLTPDLTVMADWHHIFYSGVSSVSNPSFPVLYRSLGASNGPGFGWKDTDSAAFGVEWRVQPGFALRAGYHYATNPIPSNSVTLNLLAPIINAHHISGGVSYAVTKNSSVDLAVVYAFKNSVRGPEALPQTPLTPLGAYNPAANVNLWLRGLEISVGWTYKFDAGDHSLIPTHL
ncbi:OmpP1/FadL family transporter [Methylosinus sp. Ce-a6]|uniref:OmpP1/FadL family transporter n=1 Tax=Methylosinus sp. Ce-a6 TaxID=2172005 RepID=UPI0013578675|nr:outer membrane protein transport protein [Methylosinus sp. Ce-a6]